MMVPTGLEPVGLQRNITMLTRLSTEVEAIHRAVEGLVQMESGLTDIHFQTEDWGVLTSKNNLKTELAYFTSPIAGLSNLTNIENQLTTMLQTFLAGAGPIKFGYGGLISLHHPFVGTDLIAFLVLDQSSMRRNKKILIKTQS